MTDDVLARSLRVARRHIPLLQWAGAYQRGWLVADVLAGVAVWAVVIPEGAAYAVLAGLTPQAALVAAPFGLLAYAVFGTSRWVVVGATTATAVVMASTLSTLAQGGAGRYASLAAALTLLIGVVFVAAGIARLGFVSQFLSRAILAGFVFGLAMVVTIGQLPRLLGISGSPGNFFQKAWHLLQHLRDVDGNTAAVGLGALLLLVVLQRAAPRIPAALVVAALGIGAVALFGLDHHGVRIVGNIPSGLPAPGFPSGITGDDLRTLLPGAFAICLVAYSEHMASAEALALAHGQDVDPNQELISLGVANLGAGIVKGFVVGGSLSKSRVNDAAGARTQVSSLTAAVLALVTVAAFTGVFHDLPEAVLGAVVVHAVVGLMRVDMLRRYWRLRRFDFALAMTALLGELIFDVLPGLLLAVSLALLWLIFRSSRPRAVVLGRLPGTVTYADVARHPEAQTFPGVLIVRLDGELFFANATLLRRAALDAVHRATTPDRAVLIDLEATSELDVDSLDMLDELCSRLRSMGVALHLARVRDPVRDMLARDGGRIIGDDRLHRTVEDGVEAILATVEAGPDPVRDAAPP